MATNPPSRRDHCTAESRLRAIVQAHRLASKPNTTTGRSYLAHGQAQESMALPLVDPYEVIIPQHMPHAPSHSYKSPKDVVGGDNFFKISGHNYWRAASGPAYVLEMVANMLDLDPRVPNLSDSYMRILQMLISYHCLSLDAKASAFLRQQAECHVKRYGKHAFPTRRVFLNLFRFHWSMRNLKEAKELANEMAASLRSCADVAPDAFLIWETLAADVESREGYGSPRPATLYGDLAEKYSRFEGPSNRSYEYLHRALHAFYTGKDRWEMALHYVTSAAEHLDQVVLTPSRDTESIVERRLAILVMKVTVLEALGNTAAAIHAYSDIMTACAQDQDGEMYVEQWHQVADNRITMLKLAQSQRGTHPPDEEKFAMSSVTILPTPTMAGVSLDGDNGPSSVQGGQQSSQGSNLLSHRPADQTTQTCAPAHTTAGINAVEGPESTKTPISSFLDQWATENTGRDLCSQDPNNTSIMSETKPQHSARTEDRVSIARQNTIDFMSDMGDVKRTFTSRKHDPSIRFPELDTKLVKHAMHMAAAMDVGDIDGTRLFYPPISGPVSPFRPYALVTGSEAEVPDAWLPEEGAVLAVLAERGAMRLCSDTLFRMVWCYASGYDRAYLKTLQEGRPQQRLTVPTPARKPRDLAYFFEERRRVMGDPIKGFDGGDIRNGSDHWEREMMMREKVNQRNKGNSALLPDHRTPAYYVEAAKDEELMRSLRDLDDAAQKVFLRQRMKWNMERQKQQHQREQQEPVALGARTSPIMAELLQQREAELMRQRRRRAEVDLDVIREREPPGPAAVSSASSSTTTELAPAPAPAPAAKVAPPRAIGRKTPGQGEFAYGFIPSPFWEQTLSNNRVSTRGPALTLSSSAGPSSFKDDVPGSKPVYFTWNSESNSESDSDEGIVVAQRKHKEGKASAADGKAKEHEIKQKPQAQQQQSPRVRKKKGKEKEVTAATGANPNTECFYSRRHRCRQWFNPTNLAKQMEWLEKGEDPDHAMPNPTSLVVPDKELEQMVQVIRQLLTNSRKERLAMEKREWALQVKSARLPAPIHVNPIHLDLLSEPEMQSAGVVLGPEFLAPLRHAVVSLPPDPSPTSKEEDIEEWMRRRVEIDYQRDRNVLLQDAANNTPSRSSRSRSSSSKTPFMTLLPAPPGAIVMSYLCRAGDEEWCDQQPSHPASCEYAVAVDREQPDGACAVITRCPCQGDDELWYFEFDGTDVLRRVIWESSEAFKKWQTRKTKQPQEKEDTDEEMPELVPTSEPPEQKQNNTQAPLSPFAPDSLLCMETPAAPPGACPSSLYETFLVERQLNQAAGAARMNSSVPYPPLTYFVPLDTPEQRQRRRRRPFQRRRHFEPVLRSDPSRHGIPGPIPPPMTPLYHVRGGKVGSSSSLGGVASSSSSVETPTRARSTAAPWWATRAPPSRLRMPLEPPVQIASPSGPSCSPPSSETFPTASSCEWCGEPCNVSEADCPCSDYTWEPDSSMGDEDEDEDEGEEEEQDEEESAHDDIQMHVPDFEAGVYSVAHISDLEDWDMM